MRWGTYSDLWAFRRETLGSCVSIAHALGNLFRPVATYIGLAAAFLFQSLMRWGTYSDDFLVDWVV